MPVAQFHSLWRTGQWSVSGQSRTLGGYRDVTLAPSVREDSLWVNRVALSRSHISLTFTPMSWHQTPPIYCSWCCCF